MQAAALLEISSLLTRPLDQQEEAFLELCQREGYEAAAVFVAGPEGSGFRDLVGYLRRPGRGFTLVVLSSLAALGRSPEEIARRYFQVEGLAARVLALDGEIGVEALLSAWRRRIRVAREVRAAMSRRAIQSQVLGRTPYGYRVGPHRRLEVEPEEAAVVQAIFRFYLGGLGLRRIARLLNQEGVRTRQVRPFTPVAIGDILRSRVYLGTYSRFGVRVPASHPPLVSPQEFQRVQERLGRHPRPEARGGDSVFLLSGLAYCGYCGGRLVGSVRRRRWRLRDGRERVEEYHYYHCGTRVGRGLCGYHGRRAEALEEEVRRFLLRAGPEAQVGWVTGEGEASAAVDGQEPGRAAGPGGLGTKGWPPRGVRPGEDSRKEMAHLDRQMGRLLHQAAEGRLSLPELRQQGQALAAQALALEEGWPAGRGSLARLCQTWETLPLAERRVLLEQVVARVVVRDEGVEVYIKP